MDMKIKIIMNMIYPFQTQPVNQNNYQEDTDQNNDVNISVQIKIIFFDNEVAKSVQGTIFIVEGRSIHYIGVSEDALQTCSQEKVF